MKKLILMCSILTILGACFVIVFKDKPNIVAIGFIITLIWRLIYKIIKTRRINVAIEFYMIVTSAIIGYLTESWGTENGHWTYHFVADNDSVPSWIPFAWANASSMIHCIDRKIIDLEMGTVKKLFYIFLTGCLFPLLGESPCVFFGVWTYHWSFQIINIPLFALILISYTHLVFLFIDMGLRKFISPHKRL